MYQSINTHPNCGLGPVMAAEVTKETFDLRVSSLKEQRSADKGEMPHGGKCLEASILCFSLTEPHPILVHPCPFLMKMPLVADAGPTSLFFSPM